LEHLRCGERVLLEVALRMVEALAHVGVRRQVEDRVAAFDRAAEERAVEDVAFDELYSRPGEELLGELPPAGREVVVDDDLDPVRREPLDEGAADEAGAAGDESPLHARHSVKPALTASRWNI